MEFPAALLETLKIEAVKRRCRLSDVVVEAIRKMYPDDRADRKRRDRVA